jgi:hypothetical protein
LILKNRTIRFNRLDNGLDDLQEGSISSKGVKIGNYGFVSCWTENRDEKIPLWKLYTDNGIGVRIALEKDMFKDYYYSDIVEFNGIRFNAKASGWQITKTPIEDMFNPSYMVFTLLSSDIDKGLFYRAVEYVDDVNERIKDCVTIEKVTNELNRIDVKYADIGRYKHKRWAFEEETRFFLFIIPGMNFEMGPQVTIDYNQHLYDVWTNNIRNTITYYDMHLKDNIFDDMEITLSPNITIAKRIIVEALKEKYAPKAIIKSSSFEGTVNLK